MTKYMQANIVFSKFGRDYQALKKDLPIRPSEMGLLNIITKREGLYPPVMIAELLGVSKPMVAAHVSSLEKGEYIYRDYSSEDKRSFYVMPTDKARALVEESEQKLNAQLKTIESALGEADFATLVDLLERAHGVIEQQLR